MLGTLIVRALIGGLFVGHGTQKLFGWFGGHGLDGTGQFFESLGLRPGRHNAIAAGAAETAGGAMLAAGFLTPAAGATLAGVMTTAIRHVHAEKGPWSTDGGWEYNAVLMAAAFSVVESGPGAVSLDRLFGIERKGTRWAVAATAAGVAGSLAASKLATREQPPPEPPQPESAEERVVEAAEPGASVPASQA